MALEIFNVEQGSPEWHQCRAGIPTASMFGTVMAKGRGKEPSKTRRAYMLTLLGERITGEVQESYSNAHMERGRIMEDEARSMYAFMRDVEPETVGFVRNGNKGASPDNFIGANGGLEIKTKLPHLLLDCLLQGELPPEHKPQVQGCLWVCEREWWDFMAYWPKLPPLIVRVYRDEDYIKKLDEEVTRFNDELNELHEQLKRRYAA